MFKNLWNSLVSLVKRVITYFFPEHPELVEEIKGDEELVEEIDIDMVLSEPSMEIMDVKEASTVIIDNEAGERVTRIQATGEETREIYQPENTKDFNAVIWDKNNYRTFCLNNNCSDGVMNTVYINKVEGDVYYEYDLYHITTRDPNQDIVFLYEKDTTNLLEIKDWKSKKIYWRKKGFDPNDDERIIKI